MLYAFCQADSFIEKVSLRMFERVVKGRVRGGRGGVLSEGVLEGVLEDEIGCVRRTTNILPG